MGVNDHVDKKPRKKPSQQPSGVEKSYQAEFKGYINLELTDAQKAAWVEWGDTQAPFEWFAGQVEDGVNLAIRIDPKSGGFLASATQRRESSPNAGLCVTARAREPWAALSRLLYCLAILSHGETWEAVQPMANPDRW